MSTRTMADMPRGYVELLLTIRGNFGDEHAPMALALIDHCPSGQSFTTRLGAAAYRKGLIAGLAVDSMRPEAKNPYASRGLTNFARGANNPHEAWAAGHRDGLRIKTMLNFPEKISTLVPALRWREAKIIGYEQNAVGAGR